MNATNSRTTDEQIVATILRSLGSGIPFLRFGPDADKVVICKRRGGGTIQDPDLDHDLSVLEGGIFRRFPQVTTQCGTRVVTGHAWLRTADATEEALLAALKPTLDAMSPGDREAIGVQCAFQSAMHRTRAERDQRRVSGRCEAQHDGHRTAARDDFED